MPDDSLAHLIIDSYQRLLGHSLLPSNLPVSAAAHWLYHEAPFCVLAHDGGCDPHFTYANRCAQDCFEYTASELVGLPSRLSAAAPDRAERQQLLESVSRQGYATGYRGLRIAKSGRQFWIENVTVWNLLDELGQCHGQAATYRQWRDGT